MTQQPYYSAYEPQQKKKKVPTWVWVVLISLLVVGLIVALGVAVSKRAAQDQAGIPAGTDYAAVLYVEGTMTESAPAGSVYGGTYDQEYLLDTLETLTEDEHNKGLLLYIDSPGGEVMAASDLGDAVVAYKEATGRPVYAYGHNYAASGGYWLAAAADRFYVNRYCTTGSIGVTFGDMFDFSGLLEKYGVKVNTITSGAQKSMGSSWEQMSPETRAIFKSFIDEYYGYFLDWVSEQRGMDRAALQALADGRIYTASQAVANGLADQVGDYDDCLNDLLQQTGEAEAVDFQPTASLNLYSLMFQSPVQHFAMRPENLTDAPAWAVDFMKDVPTLWDEVRFLDGYPGKYAILARRCGNRWYVAGINAQEEPLEVKLDLSFMGSSAVTVYADDDALQGSCKQQNLKKDRSLKVRIPCNGGVVIM